MKGRKQRWKGCLLFLLVLVALPGLLIWREMRRERLSAQLLAVVKEEPVLTGIDYYAVKYRPQPDREISYSRIRRDEATAVRLLQAGADPDVRDFAVVKRPFWEEIKFLLKRMLKRPPNSASLPPSALAIAVQTNDAVIVTALLKAGANDINAELDPNTGGYRFPLVNYAAYVGNLEIVQALCARGADIHKLSHNRDPATYSFPDPSEELLVRPEEEPILQSVLRGGADGVLADKKSAASVARDLRLRTEIFHLLLAQGAKYEPHSKEGYALLAVAAEGDFLDLTRELLAAGVLPNADPDWPDDPSAMTPLDYAVMADDIPLVDLLLRYGASARDYRSEPPLLYVANAQMAKLLLKYGADLQAGETRGKHTGDNRLNSACLAGANEAVMFWINLGIDVNTGGDYSSPINQAAEYGNVETVRLLLKHGAKVGPNSPGAEALWLAIAESNFDSAKLILRYGGAVNSKTHRPLTEAILQGNARMALALLKRGADVNADAGAALFAACDSCDEDLVKLLLEHGADPTLRADDGTTTLQAAKQNADPLEDADGIIALLKAYGAKRKVR